MWSWMLKEHFKSFQRLWLIKNRDLFLHACELQELEGWDLDHGRNGKISGKKERWNSSKIKQVRAGRRSHRLKAMATSFRLSDFWAGPWRWYRKYEKVRWISPSLSLKPASLSHLSGKIYLQFVSWSIRLLLKQLNRVHYVLNRKLF